MKTVIVHILCHLRVTEEQEVGKDNNFTAVDQKHTGCERGNISGDTSTLADSGGPRWLCLKKLCFSILRRKTLIKYQGLSWVKED